MTRTASSPVRVDCPRQPVAPSTQQAWTVTLVWDLAERVCRRLDTGAPEAAPADPPVAVELVSTPAATPGRANVVLDLLLRSGARQELVRRTDLPAAWLPERDFRHLDIEGVMACTFEMTDPPRPIFARCELLEEAGIPAGSYALRSAGK
ncbi:MAG: hypothetical protein ACF8LK_08620 [Phycisphaerales bacterium JB041]